MKNNEILQKEVQDAIKWEPLLHAAEIGVTAVDGVVTLTGTVDSFTKKLEAENAAKNVAGVKVVVEKIEIKSIYSIETDDTTIAKAILNAFKWNWQIPDEMIKVNVEQSCVTLEGEVNWHYQKEATENTASSIIGVKGVINKIKIISESKELLEKQGIERALARNWSIDERNINVSVMGSNVTLKGTVDYLYQKNEAGKIAWKAPGVTTVENDLVVGYNDL
ncbi:MAG: BON domain-containing protein [Bacteroidota bacterium]|uniref:BON domain-containing protein n=1 Tax=Runella sp. TaxID=1960881 RepID=UPI00301B66E0